MQAGWGFGDKKSLWIDFLLRGFISMLVEFRNTSVANALPFDPRCKRGPVGEGGRFDQWGGHQGT